VEATPPSGHPLRPLGLGEVLDRAVTLCVRFFVPLALVDAGSAVVRGLYNAYTGTDLARFWTDVAADVRAHAVIAAHPPAGTHAFSFLIVFVIEPIVGGALIAMTSEVYLGRRASLRQAYRRAWARALPLVMIAAIFLVGSFVFVVVVGALVAFGVVFASGFASVVGIWRWSASAVAVLVIVAATLALAMSAAALLLAYDLSSIACVVEGASPVRAIALSARRLFAKTRVRRTLLFAGAGLAISLGCYALVSAAVVAVPFIHSGIGANVLQTIAGAAAAMLGTAFSCIFYYDLRVREEGYDLQFAALELQLGSATVASEVSSASPPKPRALWN
jgi:hypothetical protein